MADESNNARPKVGEAFNPFKRFRGLHVPEQIAASDLHPGEKLVYGALARFAGKDGACYPSPKAVALMIGLKERQVQSYLTVLERSGLIRRRERRDGKKRLSNGFEFLWHPIFQCAGGAETCTRVVQQPALGVVQKTVKKVVQDPAHEESHDRRDSFRKESAEETKDDSQPPNRKNGASAAGVLALTVTPHAENTTSTDPDPKGEPAFRPEDVQAVADAMHVYFGRQHRRPDAEIVRKVLKAACGRPARDILALFEDRRAQGKYQPGRKRGPHTYAWFARVAANEFGAPPAGNTEAWVEWDRQQWADGATNNGDQVRSWFEHEFWPLYPRQQDKAGALAAAREIATTPDMRAHIIAMLELQLPRLSAREFSRLPSPGSWLRGERFDDEDDDLGVPF